MGGADVTDEQADKRASSGILALQLHAGPPMIVQFKNIQLKRLKPVAGKRIVLVAGTPSHEPGDHEFNAGSLILKKCLDGVAGIQASIYLNGWPERRPGAMTRVLPRPAGRVLAGDERSRLRAADHSPSQAVGRKQRVLRG